VSFCVVSVDSAEVATGAGGGGGGDEAEVDAIGFDGGGGDGKAVELEGGETSWLIASPWAF